MADDQMPLGTRRSQANEEADRKIKRLTYILVIGAFMLPSALILLLQYSGFSDQRNGDIVLSAFFAFIVGVTLGERLGVMKGEENEKRRWEKRLPDFDEEEHDRRHLFRL